MQLLVHCYTYTGSLGFTVYVCVCACTDDGKSVLLDLFGKRCERIMKELTDVAGKTE